jgi:hypothetical protein
MPRGTDLSVFACLQKVLDPSIYFPSSKSTPLLSKNTYMGLCIAVQLQVVAEIHGKVAAVGRRHNKEVYQKKARGSVADKTDAEYEKWTTISPPVTVLPSRRCPRAPI